MRLIVFIMIFAFPVFFSSCEDKENDISEQMMKLYSYPSIPGTEWVYEREMKMTKIGEIDSSESNFTPSQYTVYYLITTRVEKHTVLNDTMPVTKYISYYQGSDYPSEEYVYFDNEGMKLYAYVYYSPGGVFCNKASHFGNEIIVSEDGLFMMPGDNYHRGNLVYDDGLILAFPLSINKEWRYKNLSFSGNAYIDKKVIGNRNIHLSAGTYSCLKIQWFHHGIFEDEIIMYDYISHQGLVKRKVINPEVTLINVEGENLGIYRFEETVLLKSFKMK